MNDYNYLSDICNIYENYILSNFGSLKNFYYEAYINDAYEKFKNEITSELKLIGSGKCCQVYYKDNFHYVIKLHTPYNERIDLRNNPTKEICEISKFEIEPSEKTNWADPRALKYFLPYEYITANGLAGIQRKVDCSTEGQKRSYDLFGEIDPYLRICNHIKNMGLLNNNPVFVDWY